MSTFRLPFLSASHMVTRQLQRRRLLLTLRIQRLKSHTAFEFRTFSTLHETRERRRSHWLLVAASNLLERASKHQMSTCLVASLRRHERKQKANGKATTGVCVKPDSNQPTPFTSTHTNGRPQLGFFQSNGWVTKLVRWCFRDCYQVRRIPHVRRP